MVIVKLRFGLGNQMFQYAVGRAVADRRGDELLLDTSLLGVPEMGGSPARQYGLDMFRISARHVVPADVQNALNQSGLVCTVTEARFGFHEDILSEGLKPFRNLIIEGGAWQSERYFKHIEQTIRREFTLNQAVSLETKDVARRIQSTAAVCLHVRRADYVSSSLAAFVGLGEIGLEYYQNGVAYLTERIPGLHFYVFSDDIDWCMANLAFSHPHTYVRHATPSDRSTADDFYLMTQCSHFIIANSSFSWWGAWLSANPGKTVIAPRHWLKHSRLGGSGQIVPPGWIQL
jgi:hypothetical protein